jgi:hypothetical protein
VLLRHRRRQPEPDYEGVDDDTAPIADGPDADADAAART